MLYQTLLTDERPYAALIGKMHGFENHRHPEIEMSYCVQGSYDIIIDKKRYTMHPGDLALIGSMTPHEVPPNEYNGQLSLTIEVGPVLLGEHFKTLVSATLSNPVFNLYDRNEEKLNSLFKEVAELRINSPAFADLQIRGNLFKICGYILSTITDHTSSGISRQLRTISRIENALELIRTRYNENLDIGCIAEICGYSKSNFCKTFKNITGKTFHSMLNVHRLMIAKNLLRETDLSVEAIALKTGFADSKSFCRVFKLSEGISPGKHRNFGD